MVGGMAQLEEIHYFSAYEEKETDVAIACKVLSHAQRDALDAAVLITGDSDFSPLARTFKHDFPDKEIRFADGKAGSDAL